MTTQPKIYVAGHRGMVGSAIVRNLTQQAMDCRASLAMTKREGVIASEARQGVNEVGYWNDKPVIKIDPRYFRPAEVETLLGDPTKAKTKLGWTPEITAQEMCREMVANDLAQAKQHALLKRHGYQVNVSVE